MHEYHNFTENHHVTEIEFCGHTGVLWCSLIDTLFYTGRSLGDTALQCTFVCHCVSVVTVWHAHCTLPEAYLGPARFF